MKFLCSRQVWLTKGVAIYHWCGYLPFKVWLFTMGVAISFSIFRAPVRAKKEKTWHLLKFQHTPLLTTYLTIFNFDKNLRKLPPPSLFQFGHIFVLVDFNSTHLGWPWEDDLYAANNYSFRQQKNMVLKDIRHRRHRPNMTFVQVQVRWRSGEGLVRVRKVRFMWT